MAHGMRRKDREMSEDFAWAVVDQCNHIVVSVMDEKEGTPYSIPVLMARKGNLLYYHSYSEGRMYDIMKTAPRVCVSAVSIASIVPRSFDLTFASAILFGKAEIVDDDEEKIEAIYLTGEKYSKELMHMLETKIPFSMPHMGIIRITVEEITGKANLPGLSRESY